MVPKNRMAIVFGKYDSGNVQIADITLSKYINFDTKLFPHTFGRSARRHFEKGKMSIIERLINKIMRSGQGKKKMSGKFIRGRGSCGKKLQAIQIVEDAFAIVETRTKQNPLQVLVKAIENAAPREEVTRVAAGGVSYQLSVDVSATRRLDVVLRNITLSALMKAFDSKASLSATLADEIVNTAKGDLQTSYSIKKKDGSTVEIDNPVRLPPTQEPEELREPMIRACIIVPNQMISSMMKLAQERRGECVGTESLDKHRVILTMELPFNEVVINFYDRLKTVTSGYGSMDYEHIGFRASDIVKLDILINKEPVDAFSLLVHRSKAEHRGRQLTEKLKEVIPQQLFRVAIQAAIGNRIIASEVVRPLKKDVTAKCYGGDITRKRKLWEKQKEGKKRMKQIGKINIPQKAFIEVMKMD